MNVRPRALVLGALLAPLAVGVSQFLEIAGNYPGLAQGPYPSNYLIPFPVLVALLLLLAGNQIALRRGKEAWLGPQELLAIYAMLAISIVAGSAMFGAGILQVVGVVPHAAPSPAYDLLHPLLSQRLTVTDPRVLEALYNGARHPPWGLIAATLGPILAWWGAFMVVVGLLLYGLASLFSRQWTHHERLAYPVAQIPLAMVQPEGKLWQSRVLWLGLLIPVVLHTVNGATRLYPAVPPLKIVHYADYLTGTRPWNSAWPIILHLNLSAIGIGFFVPTDVLFSAWFFVWLAKAALVVTNALGFGEPTIYQGAPYITEHSYGGYLALAAYTLWWGRGHLRRTWWGPGAAGRRLVVLLGAGALAMTLFTHYLVGLAWWAAALFVVLFLAFSLALGRLRAQAAPPDAGLTIGQADALMKVTMGSHVLDGRSLVGLSLYLNSFTRWGMRNPIGAISDALRLRQEEATGWRWVAPLALGVAIPSGLVITLWLYVHYGLGLQAYYWQGASGVWMRDDAASRVEATGRWEAGPLVGVVSGFGLTSALAALRARFVGFPLHPIGFVIAAGYGMHQEWFSVFLVWAIKASLVRWGGLRIWRAAFPCFVGLIVGEAVMQAAWAGLNVALGTKYYTCTE